MGRRRVSHGQAGRPHGERNAQATRAMGLALLLGDRRELFEGDALAGPMRPGEAGYGATFGGA